LGFQVVKPRASFYLYVRIPSGVKGGARFETAEDFSQWLIREKLISTVPWDDVGHYVRFSVTFIAKNAAEEKKIMQEIRNRLGDVEFEW
jgi:LL-diaminopimelate aminotransferase